MLKYYHSRIKLERIIEEDKENDSPTPSVLNFNNPNSNNYDKNDRKYEDSTEMEIDESLILNPSPASSDEEQNTPPIPSNPIKLNNIKNDLSSKSKNLNITNNNNSSKDIDLNGYYQLALGLFPLCPSLYNVFVRYEEIDISLNNILLLTNRVKVLSNLLQKKTTLSRYELLVENLAYRIDLFKVNSIQISEICSICLEVSKLMSYVDPVFRNPISMDDNQLNKILKLTLDHLKSIKTKLSQLFTRNEYIYKTTMLIDASTKSTNTKSILSELPSS
ncbi:hypothetical protein PPL_04565 [Heterostelium album PN500]|uniref:Uncharacterized protein n=1 Tax=Heterostelium pallidum (strain ATCC 26659 / Pp 5 / PN500) TaxID=670386 RepID=D3B7X7_HETP5|nr:hypothetical protein PPL_04565 [Heterostelium album PN500]EFA82145.1 hypothetical protein PPL_04565 [Heterostelium album PN500]|eukprot:XP_020434262.1 hypothetical protein PPL_04565 [Heterostelium album PN500]